MQRDARAYGATLSIAAALVTLFAAIYSIQQHIPLRLAVAFTAAVLLEIPFYLAPGFASARAFFESIEPAAARALAIQLSTLPPYLVYSLGTGTFHWRNFALLAGLTTVIAAWYAVQTKKHFYADLLFLTLFAAVSLLKVFPRIYIELAPHATASILGQLMWIRLGILSVLAIRGLSGTGFGFLPTRKDWSIGVQHFLMFAPVALVCGTLLKFAQPHNAFTVWWHGLALFIATFAGILWVVALWEEFFCRGMLQQLFIRRFKSTALGVVAASAIFGLSHLPFRHFPNWKLTILATLAGLFYGWAYLRAGSVRAAMVAHAFVVSTWRVFFG